MGVSSWRFLLAVSMGKSSLPSFSSIVLQSSACTFAVNGISNEFWLICEREYENDDERVLCPPPKIAPTITDKRSDVLILSTVPWGCKTATGLAVAFKATPSLFFKQALVVITGATMGVFTVDDIASIWRDDLMSLSGGVGLGPAKPCRSFLCRKA
jgi:hypothetical protein